MQDAMSQMKVAPKQIEVEDTGIFRQADRDMLPVQANDPDESGGRKVIQEACAPMERLIESLSAVLTELHLIRKALEGRHETLSLEMRPSGCSQATPIRLDIEAFVRGRKTENSG